MHTPVGLGYEKVYIQSMCYCSVKNHDDYNILDMFQKPQNCFL